LERLDLFYILQWAITSHILAAAWLKLHETRAYGDFLHSAWEPAAVRLKVWKVSRRAEEIVLSGLLAQFYFSYFSKNA
jgi:hypothetical protein